MDTFDEIHRRRGLVLQDMALVEMAMNRLISLYFTGKNKNDVFISELLQEQYFSFELRKRLFKKIFKEKYPEDSFDWEALDEMQKIRNIIAHARVDESVLKEEGNGIVQKSSEPFYSYHTKTEDASTIHDSFRMKMAIMAKSLNKIKGDTGFMFSVTETGEEVK